MVSWRSENEEDVAAAAAAVEATYESTPDQTFTSQTITDWTSENDAQQREDDKVKEETQKKSSSPCAPRLQGITVASCAFLNIYISIGFPYSLGVLYNDLMFTFNVGRRDVTIVIALCTGILSAAGAIAGIIINKFGLRKTMFLGSFLGSCGTFASSFATGIPFLIVSLGTFTGLGYSLVYVSALVAMGNYFSSENNTVFALVTMGAAIGIMTFPLIFTAFIACFGWRGAMMILSGICLNSFVFSLLLTPPKSSVKVPESELKEEKENSPCFDFSIFRNKSYVAYLVVLCVTSGSLTCILITLPDILRTRGFSLETAAFFLSVESMADITGRLIYCQLSCFKRLTSEMIYYAATLMLAVTLIIFPNLNGIALLYTGTCFVGTSAGMFLSVYCLVVLEIIGPKKYPSAIGFAETMCGIGNILLGALSGYIGEANHSFDSSLRLLGIISVATIGLVLLIYLICTKIDKRKRSKKESTMESEGHCNRAFSYDQTTETNNKEEKT